MMKNNQGCFLLTVIITAIIILTSPVHAGEHSPVNFSNARDHWTLLGGYGETHRDLGATETRVQQIDAILQYGFFLTEEIGKSWYAGRHEVLIELPVSAVFHPDDAIMAGINILACWDFTASDTFVPYVFAGGGILYTNLDVPELGSDYNGNYQSGVGIHFHLKENTTIDFNYRLHHISNAGTSEPNGPLNSSKLLIGASFLFK